MRRFNFLLIGFLFLLPTISWADDANSASASPPANPTNFPVIKDQLGLDVTGYIDGSYNYLDRSNSFTSGVFDRVYDLQPNGLTLQQAAVTIARQPAQGFGGVLNLILGRDAFTTSAFGLNPRTGIKNIGFDPLQAFLQFAAGPVTVIGGRFVSLAGAETINPTTDNNFSRSILFGYAEPGTHTGVRSTIVVNDKVSFIAGVNDGWDTIRDTSRNPTLEFGLIFNPSSLLSFAVQDYNGEQRVIDRTAFGPTGRRNLVDVVGTLNATKQLSFVANYDYGTQENVPFLDGTIGTAMWQGIAGYINYKFNDQWRTSFRAEDFSDRDAYRTGVAQNWKELTLTLAYSPIKCLEFRAETRHDFSNVASFVNRDGITVGSNQQSFALEGIYKF